MRRDVLRCLWQSLVPLGKRKPAEIAANPVQAGFAAAIDHGAPDFLVDDQSIRHHTMTFGVSGSAHSQLLQLEANRLGIPYDELHRRMQPTGEELAARECALQQVRQRQAKRLVAVCEAYWAHTAQSDRPSVLWDALVMAGIVGEPTESQQKALLLMLPAKIVGLGLAWGFSDTEAGDSILSFVRENHSAVLAKMTEVG